MECGILLIFPLLLSHLLLVHAADDVNVDTQVNAGNVSAINECYWSGEGPICDGKCRAGETVVSESKKNDGNGCIIGKKMYCCKGGAVLSGNTTGVAPHHVKRQHEVENQVTNSSTGGQLPLGDTKDDCYWVGKSPNCKGSCLEGDYMVNTSRTANGSTCIVGKKKYCCPGTNNTLNNVPAHSSSTAEPPTMTTVKQMLTNGNSSSCYWVGKPPICLGSCKFGDYVADKSPTGDGGEKCESGQKKFCCARQQSTAPVSTEEPPHKTIKTIGQMDKVNDSISNSTSRPFQARHRPTPRGLPINSTVTNRVKIVKIKRKLAMSTPTSENVSTSISTSETLSTLAMASFFTLPSTTESTTTTASTTTATTTTTTTTTAKSTTTATTSSTPIPTTSATRSTSTATESTSVATEPSTPASSTSIKPTTASSAPKKFAPFFDLPDVLPVPLIFRIQKSADTGNSSDGVTTSIIQSTTTSATTTPTTLE